MQGKQLVQMVPIEPGKTPIPKIPRPVGLFDQFCFANSSAFDVTGIDLTLGGPPNPVFQTALPSVAAGQYGLSTLDVNTGQHSTVELAIHVAGQPDLHLPPVSTSAAYHVGRVHAGLAGDHAGAVMTPYCVITLFPDNPQLDDVLVQVVPHADWA